jgi:hypothetical protein
MDRHSDPAVVAISRSYKGRRVTQTFQRPFQWFGRADAQNDPITTFMLKNDAHTEVVLRLSITPRCSRKPRTYLGPLLVLEHTFAPSDQSDCKHNSQSHTHTEVEHCA